jgi:hypothetical protein
VVISWFFKICSFKCNSYRYTVAASAAAGGVEGGAPAAGSAAAGSPKAVAPAGGGGAFPAAAATVERVIILGEQRYKSAVLKGGAGAALEVEPAPVGLCTS